MQNLDQAIRERAYHLWIAAGCPEGNSDAHWLDAQRELLTSSVAAGTSEVRANTKAKTKAKAKTPVKTVKKSADKPKAPARSKRRAA